VNPKRVRDFARAMGVEAKTDRVDAKVIAKYGQVTDPRATPVLPPERQELAELLACRKQLIDEITVRKQQLEHLQGDRPRAIVGEMIDCPNPRFKPSSSDEPLQREGKMSIVWLPKERIGEAGKSSLSGARLWSTARVATPSSTTAITSYGRPNTATRC